VRVGQRKDGLSRPGHDRALLEPRNLSSPGLL
jgi:hypothetical protein